MKVPVYEQPDVQPSSLPAERISLDTRGAFGEGIGQAVGGIADLAQNVYLEEKKKADAAAVTDFENRFQAQKDVEFYGPPDNPGTGLMSLRGEAAVARSKDTYSRLQQFAQKGLDGLQNDSQRDVAKMRLGGLMEDATREAERHVSNQVEVDHQLDAAAARQLAKRDIFNNYKDDGSYGRQTEKVETSIRALAPTPTVGDAQAAQWRGEAAEARLEGYLHNKNYQGASDFLALSRKDLGDSASSLQDRVDALQSQLTGATAAQALLNTNRQPNGYISRDAVYTGLAAMPEGKVKEDTRKELEPRLGMAEAAFKQQEGERLGRLGIEAEKTGGHIDETSKDYQDLSDAGKREAMKESMALQRQLRISNRTDSQEDRRAQREANDNARAAFAQVGLADPQAQASVDINREYSAADAGTRANLMTAQKALRSALAKGQGEPISEAKQQFAKVSEQMPFDKQTKTDFQAKMDLWYLRQMAANDNRPPTRKEVADEVINQLQEDSGGLLGFGKRRRFQYGPDENFTPAQEQKPLPASLIPSPIKSQPLPAGVVKGKSGKLYRQGSGGKWEPYGG